MSIWRTKPVSDQPSLSLDSWRVYELPDGSRHLVGYCVENGEGRVTSAVAEFDTLTMAVKTASGRAYSLRGAPGFNSDAMYVWTAWVTINKVTDFTDVSNLVHEEHLAAVAKSTA